MKADKEDLVQIGELAQKLGITTRTIRYYEEIGLMGHPERLEGGTRMYTREDILRLKFILKMKNLGITLREMQELAENYDENYDEYENFDRITPRLLEILDQHIHKVDEKISALSSLRKDIVDYRSRIINVLKEQAARG
ncbi:MAG: MerR family transcriptional regulator [Desulfuromonadales bacterium]